MKDFYLRIIGYLSKLSNFNEFKDVLKSVFIVCQSKGIDNAEVEKNKRYLLDLIKFHSCNFCPEDCMCDFCTELKLENENVMENDEESEEGNLEKDGESKEGNYKDYQNEVKRIQKDALNYITENESSNEFYCPHLVKNISTLCSEFVVWTNIMTDHFKSNNTVATSGRSES